jgi:hypothetical protein
MFILNMNKFVEDQLDGCEDIIEIPVAKQTIKIPIEEFEEPTEKMAEVEGG